MYMYIYIEREREKFPSHGGENQKSPLLIDGIIVFHGQIMSKLWISIVDLRKKHMTNSPNHIQSTVIS